MRFLKKFTNITIGGVAGVGLMMLLFYFIGLAGSAEAVKKNTGL